MEPMRLDLTDVSSIGKSTPRPATWDYSDQKLPGEDAEKPVKKNGFRELWKPSTAPINPEVLKKRLESLQPTSAVHETRTLNKYLRGTSLLLMALGAVLYMMLRETSELILLVSGVFLFMFSSEPDEQETPFSGWQWYF
ncbi:MAG: hypothetical protein HQL87_10540 [Magnetococcales bacterium]|nr:hypothetical protein [Magnetococcales bacterium]